MGMFDNITYNGKVYQTKDTPAQAIADYEIRGDELWYKDVEYEWVEDASSFVGGHLKEISHEWKFVPDFTDKVTFYDYKRVDSTTHYHEEWESLFLDGKMTMIRRTV